MTRLSFGHLCIWDVSGQLGSTQLVWLIRKKKEKNIQISLVLLVTRQRLYAIEENFNERFKIEVMFFISQLNF